MEGRSSDERDGDLDGEKGVHEEGPVVPRSRVEALINAILQYQDVYPVLQRVVQFLCQELSEQDALVDMVNAMLANIDSPSFINSCFELLIQMINIAEERITAALKKTDIFIILDKIVHKVVYQNESACLQHGIHILSRIVANLTSIETRLWIQLVATTAQAMLTNSLDNTLELECLLSLKLLFQLKKDGAIPATSANVILKKLDQCNLQPAGASSLFASAAVAVVFRIFDTAPGSLRKSHMTVSAPILAAELHRLKTNLTHAHKCSVENLLEEPLDAAVHNSLTRLIDLAVPPAELHTETQMTSFQSAAMKLVLGVVWREEARAVLDSGGIAVLLNVFVTGAVLTNTAIETALAQSMLYVSMHWPDETWNDIQVSRSGIGTWIEVISERCNDGDDGLVHYFLAMINTLLPCEGFREAFTSSNGVAIFQSVLHTRQQLPLCTRAVIDMAMSEPHICPKDSVHVMCSLVAHTMLALETSSLCQLECVPVLTLLISQQCNEHLLLSSQNVRDVVCVMRSKLEDCLFTVEMLSLVVNALLNRSIRASFIDRGILQVVSKAICMYQWSPTETAGSNARWIICDVAHKLDVSRNLSTLEPYAQISSELSFNPSAISTEALDACCCVVGALASVKGFLPSLIEENAIEYTVGILRYAKQELVMRSESSFAQLVMTCFYTLGSIVNAPLVTQVMETTAVDAKTIDGRAVLSRLIDSAAGDIIIGCLEEALRVKTTQPLLMDCGCRLLQAILAFPLPISTETESRWIAVATSILKREVTQPRTRELLFGTTLAVLSRGRRSIETAGGQHVKMMKVILEGLSDSIQHESSCTLLQGECTGAVRVLEEIAKASDCLSDSLVSRCLGVLGKLLGIFMLSPSTTAQEHLVVFDNAVALFATTRYVNRLISRLELYMTREAVTDPVAVVGISDDFKALEALLFSSQAKKTIDACHRLFGCLADVVENPSVYAMLGGHVPFFMELGCLTSQLLPTAQREVVINTALCQFAEDTEWHSMRWIAALEDRGSSEFTLIVEFVLLRIVSGYTILDPALLMELFDALSYLLRCNQCKEIVLASSHFKELEGVLWDIVRADLAHLETESGGYDIAVSVLSIISVLLSNVSEDMIFCHSEDNWSNSLVRFCLEALDNFFSGTSVGLTKIVLLEEAFQATSIILQYCTRLGAEHARSIIQHRTTRHVANMCAGASVVERKQCQMWYLMVLKTVIQSHGILYAERLLNLSSNPSTLLINLVENIVQDKNILPWNCFADCVTLVHNSADINEYQTDCNALFEKFRKQSMDLTHGQATIIDSRRVKKHIMDTIAQLSLKYAQLCSETSQSEVDGCLHVITQSGLAYYELFISASSFGVCEYSAVVSLHLKIARLAGLRTDTERSIVEESAITFIRHLLDPICISDEAVADYIDLMAVVYLSHSRRAAAWLFTDASTPVLLTCMHRLTTGLVRSAGLEKNLVNCFSSLRVVFAARWETGEVKSVLELLKICSPDKWSQGLLLESVLVLPQGLLHVFELARAAPSNDVHVIIMAFLFQHVNDIRYKTQRIGELELSAIFSMVKRNLAGKVGDTTQRRWREVTGSEMLLSSLEILNHFARRKDCADVCSDLGGINTLYDVLCAPSQYQNNVQVALEICCYLAGYGADLTHENATFALQLLFVYVETNEDRSRARLAFLVLEFVLAVGIPATTMSLIQTCRTQIVPASARSYEEAEMFIQQLYIIRQKLVRPVSKPKSVSSPDTHTESSSVRPILNETDIRDIITSSCRNIVQCSSEEDGSGSYVDVKTSGKNVIEPPLYSRLREAVDQLGFVLDDVDMVTSGNYVSDLVPALCEILILHTITTPMICTIMQELDQIAFVNPSLFFSDKQVDIRALFASCSLHQRTSLQFARHFARFCNSIAAECQESSEYERELLISLLPLLLELLQTWKSELDIVDQCLAAVRELVDLIPVDRFEFSGPPDILTLLNAVVLPFLGNSPISWNWLKFVLAIVNKSDRLVIESAKDSMNTVIGIIRMYMSHSFMVEKALQVIIRMYKEKRQLHPKHLVELGGVQVLLTCLELHANDESIASTCLEVLVVLVSQKDTLCKTIGQLLAAAAAAPILLVCKKSPDNPLVCRMCIVLVCRMVQTFETHPSVKLSVLRTENSKNKSELLAHLLEADIVPLLFDLLDNHSIKGSHRVLDSILRLLKSLTKDERLREAAEIFHGLQELQQMIDRVWENNFDTGLIELAIDCLVNLACSDRAIGHGWSEISMWLLLQAESIHKLETASTGMCVEKLIGILGRLTIDSTICKEIMPKGSFIALELLFRVGKDRSLEQALYGLLCTLCEDTPSAQILIVYDAIPIAAERITRHIDDEETLISSLCFFDLLVLNSGESYPALLDECVFEALELVVREYPEITGGQMHRIANTILEKVSALDFQSTRTKPTQTKPTKMLKPQLQISESEKPFHDLLHEGATFRVLWEAKPDTVESIQVKLAPSGDYFLFRRKTTSELPHIERIFVSQLEVRPQRPLLDQSKVPGSPPSSTKKTLTQSLLRENFEGDQVLRLKIRNENVLVKTSSTRERIHWAQALQWLTLHRHASTAPTNFHF